MWCFIWSYLHPVQCQCCHAHAVPHPQDPISIKPSLVHLQSFSPIFLVLLLPKPHRVIPRVGRHGFSCPLRPHSGVKVGAVGCPKPFCNLTARGGSALAVSNLIPERGFNLHYVSYAACAVPYVLRTCTVFPNRIDLFLLQGWPGWSCLYAPISPPYPPLPHSRASSSSLNSTSRLILSLRDAR